MYVCTSTTDGGESSYNASKPDNALDTVKEASGSLSFKTGCQYFIGNNEDRSVNRKFL